jgi:hypothetical protein
VSTVENEDQDWELRQLCPDDACVGVLGSDGRCKVCGTASPLAGAYRPATPRPRPEAEPEQPREAAGDDTFDDRQLCPDGACIGVLGADGRCSVCGQRGES